MCHRKVENHSLLDGSLIDLVGNRTPPDPYELDDLQSQISELLQVQDDRLADDVHNLSLGSPGSSLCLHTK